jgi:outer membrane lipoprotein SlyB
MQGVQHARRGRSGLGRRDAAAHALEDTHGFEYIARKPNGDLLSVTQKDEVPLAVGQHVLIIAGPQARIVADYTTPPAAAAVLQSNSAPIQLVPHDGFPSD